MATAAGVPPGPWRLAVGRLLLRHPELGPAAGVTAAWVVLLILAAGDAPAGSRGGMPGMAVSGGTAGPVAAWAQAAAGLPSWTLMTVAMMGPAALGAIRHTGLNSLRWRRRRAMAEFSAAYLAVWAGFGLLALAAAPAVPKVPGPGALALVLAVAAAWQMSPFKRSCLRGCHRSVPLPPRGWRADKGALRFGLRNGLYCLGSCWCMMLVMIAAPGGQLLWSAGLAAIITAERILPRPRRTTRAVAAMLGFATLASLAVGNLLQ